MRTALLAILLLSPLAAPAPEPAADLLLTGGRVWTADPARGIAGDAAVRAEDVHVRLPVDWDSVDPIPPALAELMARDPLHVPLDDVVPGEPEPAHREVHA